MAITPGPLAVLLLSFHTSLGAAAHSASLDSCISSAADNPLHGKFEAQIEKVTSDLEDLRATNEILEKNLAERKKKSGQERKKLEEEIEELKSQHEEDIASLKEKLRRQKSSIDASTSEQITQVEQELNKEWKEKCDRLLASTQDKHQRALQDLQEDNQNFQETLETMEKKLAGEKAMKGDTNKQMQQLQGQVEEWKTKYENLRSQSASVKDKYEQRIRDLEDQAVEKAQQSAATGGATAGGMSRQDVVGEVKKIMSSVYHELKGEFDADKTYKGSDIHSTILDTVKSTTMEMVRSAEEEEDEEDEYSGKAEVVEKMEIASVGGALTAPAPKAAAKKVTASAEKKGKEAKGGFSLAALEGSIITEGATVKDKTPAQAGGGKSDPKKAKIEDTTKPKRAPVTGDKGNPYYAEELMRAAEMAKARETMVHAPITGDKGNPYYAEELRKAAAKTTSAAAPMTSAAAPMTSAAAPMTYAAPPPMKSSKEDKAEKKDDKKTATKAAEGKDDKADDKKREKDKEVLVGVCGDRGNPHYAEELRRAAQMKAEAIKQHVGHVTGDKGNPYYAAELAGKKLEGPKSEPDKRSREEVLKGLEAAIFAGADMVVEEEKKTDSKPDAGKSKDEKPGQGKKETKKEEAKKDSGKKQAEKKAQKQDEVVDPLFGAVTTPAKPAEKKKATEKPSLFEEDKPLFGDDKDTMGDMLGKKTDKDAKKKKVPTATLR